LSAAFIHRCWLCLGCDTRPTAACRSRLMSIAWMPIGPLQHSEIRTCNFFLGYINP
jgi:hypothetical protein